jgi:hypothetical protein
VPVAHTCSPSYLRGWDWEDHGSRTAWANSLADHIAKITRVKWTGGVAQAVECLLCKCEARSSSSSPKQNKQQQTTHEFYLHTFSSLNELCSSKCFLFLLTYSSMDSISLKRASWSFLKSRCSQNTISKTKPIYSPSCVF